MTKFKCDDYVKILGGQHGGQAGKVMSIYHDDSIIVRITDGPIKIYDERDLKLLHRSNDSYTKPSPRYDEINKAAHYNKHPSGVECIDVIEHFNLNIGNIIKYCWRAGLKSNDTIKDLKKAEYYIKREIKRLENEPMHTL